MGLIVAHEKKTAIELLRRIKRGHAAMPSTVTVGDYTFPTKPKLYRDNDNELIFCWDYDKESPTEFSTITAATAKGEWSVGRGFTFHHILFSEAGMPEYHNGEVFNAAMQCLPTTGEAWMESSPKGAAGPMYRYFKDALNLRNNWTAHFERFTDHPEYARKPAPGESTEPMNEFERELMEHYGCNVEQMLFARWKVKNALSDGSTNPIDAFHEEYPIDPDRCWLVQGDMYFPVEIVTEGIERARNYMNPTRPEYIPLKKYTVYHGWRGSEPERIVEEKLGLWHFIEMPRLGRDRNPDPRHQYAIMADPAEGKQGGDHSIASVWHKEVGEKLRNIGYFKAVCTVPEFAFQIKVIWNLFGQCLVAPEINNHGHGLVLALRRLGVHNIYRMKKKDKGSMYPGMEALFGFETNKYTRPRALEVLTESMLVESNNPDSQYAIWSPFPELWEQYRTFVYNSNGRPEAAGTNEDDYVTNAWIAAYVFFDQGGIGITEMARTETRMVTGDVIPLPTINEIFSTNRRKTGKYA
jgi:hypothetical protein